jgi:uncharacterized tellurite resistance protein B-like protein
MLKALRKLFDESPDGQLAHREVRHLHVAVACLLHESKRVDLGEDAAEHQAALDALGQLFHMDTSSAEALLADGRDKAARLTSYFSPVAIIKRDFDLARRIALIEHLWRIAYADRRLDPDEDHYVRKIAHLLYVPNTQSMLARSRARAAYA